MISALLTIISLFIVVFTIFCFINILLSWIPGAKFTRFGKLVSAICDPYMNFFSKWGWFRVRNLDFSPIISIGLLTLISSILGQITATGRISFGNILATILSMCWNICSSLFGLFFLVVFIRWIILLINHGDTDYNSIWYQVDNFVGNFCRKLSGTIIRKPHKYETSLLITWISILLTLGIATKLIGILTSLCLKIPF